MSVLTIGREAIKPIYTKHHKTGEEIWKQFVGIVNELYITYIQITNDITFEFIKNLNLPQQQSLDFPSVLSAISR